MESVLEGEGYKFDEIRAVLDNGIDDIPDIMARLEALKNIRKKPDFNQLILGYKRGRNIINQAGKSNIKLDEIKVDAGLFTQSEEKELYREYMRVESEIADLYRERKYDDILLSLVSLRAPIDSFFEKVLVMADDAGVKNNRLALLREIAGLFRKIGNLSLLQ